MRTYVRDPEWLLAAKKVFSGALFLRRAKTPANQQVRVFLAALKFFGGFRRKASLDCFVVFFVVKIFCCGLRPRPGIVFGCVVLVCTPRGDLFANGEPKRRNYNTVLSLPTVVTLRRATGVNPWAYLRLSGNVVLARTSTLETAHTEKWIESPLFCPLLQDFRPE